MVHLTDSSAFIACAGEQPSQIYNADGDHSIVLLFDHSVSRFIFTPLSWQKPRRSNTWAVLLRHRMMSLWNNVCEAALAKSPQLLCGLPLHTRLVGHGVKLLLHMWWDN